MELFRSIGAVTACIASFSFSSPVNSATIYTTGTFSDVTNLTEYYDPGDLAAYFDYQKSDITGLQQFNPALGLLTGVTLTTNFNVSVTGSIQAASSIDPDLDHSASFIVSDGNTPGVVTVVSYHTTPISFLSLAHAITEINPGCTGNEDRDNVPCAGVEQRPFIFGDESAITGVTLDQIGLSNILGTGLLTGLSVGSLHPFGSIFTTNNLVPEETSGSVETVISAGTVTLAYEYTAVPLPAAVWLLGSGLMCLVGVGRRKKAV